MPVRSVSREFRIAVRSGAAAAMGWVLAALLPAATPLAGLPELDEVQVSANVPWPLEDYVEFPRYDSVVISPDGRHLAFAWGEDNFQRRLSIVEFPSMKPVRSGLLQTYFGVSDLHWLDTRRLLVQMNWPLPGLRWLREPLGTVLVTDLDGRTLHELNPVPVGTVDAFDLQLRREKGAAGVGSGPDASGPVRAITVRADEKDRLLLQTLWAGHGPDAGGFGVFQLNLQGGEQSRIARLPLRGGHVITGPDHRPALVAGMNAVGEQVVYYLPGEGRDAGTDWKLLVRGDRDRRALRPVAWTGQGEEYYSLDGRNTPTRAVVVWNARDNTQRLPYRHPDADMDEIRLDPSGQPWLFSGVSHHPVYWYPDPAHPLAQLHRTLAQQLAPEHVDILNASDDLSTAVVRVSSGKRPTMYLVVDVKTARSITGMHTYPKLRGRRLSSVDAIELRARDGLVIRGYLTTPLDSDGKPRDGLPLLVIAHGGPRGEVAGYRYDFERQLFASRGYAVLEVNARGSVGRGAAFEQAGEGRWGREVQDDFADAVRWAIKDGVAASGRVCFYGTGYGAYSAMLAAAREPELFQCVIGVAGVYDLPRMIRDMESSRSAKKASPDLREYLALAGQLTLEARQLHEAGVMEPKERARQRTSDMQEATSEGIGSWLQAVREGHASALPPDEADLMAMYLLLQRAFGSGLEELRSRSPTSHASAIKARVLLLHQHLDKQVASEQTQAMASALRSAGNRPQVDTIGREHEGYFSPTTRTAVYSRMLRFMDQHIGQ